MSNNESRKIKILLVEDDDFLASLCAKKLEKENFQTIIAEDGKKGLEKIISDKPDLVLLDVLLPQMNGLEVLKEAKKNPETRDIPIVLLSNLARPEEIEQGLELGAVDYIVKAQYDLGQIIERVKKILKL